MFCAVCPPMAMENPDIAKFRESEDRISRMTLLFGVLASLSVLYFKGRMWALGIFLGAALAWLNFRLLKRGLDALTAAATAQADRKTVRVPLATYFAAALRYGLIALCVYVIFKYLKVPILSLIVGLCALGAAAIFVSVLELFGEGKPRTIEWKKK
jgi:small-conductance mechanosensitive channel